MTQFPCRVTVGWTEAPYMPGTRAFEVIAKLNISTHASFLSAFAESQLYLL